MGPFDDGDCSCDDGADDDGGGGGCAEDDEVKKGSEGFVEDINSTTGGDDSLGLEEE